jgi:hypothetical protein
MNHRLNQKFLALVVIKGLIVGYAQWAGAITAPKTSALVLHTSGLDSDLLRLKFPSILTD